MKKEPLPDREGFQISIQTEQSFQGRPRFYRLSGPGALVRLVQFGRTDRTGKSLIASKFEGSCWFEERHYQIFRTRALQQLSAERGAARSEPWMVGLHMKFNLREDFAISQDWNLFDAYITFSFGPNESIVILAGKTYAQPYYSAADPRHNSTGMVLAGMGEQYVIDFQFPANRHLVDRIRGPFYIGNAVKQAKR